MSLGVAFIRGVGMFGHKNYSSKETLSCLKRIENKDLEFIGMHGNDNIVFRKQGMHYATVGGLIEKRLKEEFGEKFEVTTRSFGTITGLVNKFREK